MFSASYTGKSQSPEAWTPLLISAKPQLRFTGELNAPLFQHSVNFLPDQFLAGPTPEEDALAVFNHLEMPAEINGHMGRREPVAWRRNETVLAEHGSDYGGRTLREHE